MVSVQKHKGITLFTDLGETGSHFMYTMLSGFTSNILQLLCLNPL